jgi:hypothetical protein
MGGMSRIPGWPAAIVLLLFGNGAFAQTPPDGAVGVYGGRLAFGGEIAATFGGSDERAYFNHTDYEQSALRLFRVSVTGAWRVWDSLSLVGEIRSENLETLRAHALYLRVTPWRGRRFDLQAGRIPPAFGSFGRRGYIRDNPFIGYPLAYQYLTSLRADAVPATREDLLRMRGRGWLASYPVGSDAPAPGVPVVSAFQWDTGIQGHWQGSVLDLTAAWTVGTLSDPRVRDNNGGRQFSARAGLRPFVGLVLGGSAARGEWLGDDVRRVADLRRASPQTAVGLDAEYSRAHWLVRAEFVSSVWQLPFAGGTRERLRATGGWVEGRYRLTPRLTAAGRIDTLRFSPVLSPPEGDARTWEAPVSRVEATLAYRLGRRVEARIGVQGNRRDGGPTRRRIFVAGQLAYWF